MSSIDGVIGLVSLADTELGEAQVALYQALDKVREAQGKLHVVAGDLGSSGLVGEAIDLVTETDAMTQAAHQKAKVARDKLLNWIGNVTGE